MVPKVTTLTESTSKMVKRHCWLPLIKRYGGHYESSDEGGEYKGATRKELICPLFRFRKKNWDLGDSVAEASRLR